MYFSYVLNVKSEKMSLIICIVFIVFIVFIPSSPVPIYNKGTNSKT